MGNTQTILDSQEGILKWKWDGASVTIGGLTLTTYKVSDDVAATRWLIIGFIMALIQVGTIWAIIISWAYNLLVSRTLILISILEIGVLISAIMLFIIFFQFKEWTRRILVSANKKVFFFIKLLI